MTVRWVALIAMLMMQTGCGFKPAVSWSQLDGPVEVISEQPYNTVERELKILIQQSLASYDTLPQIEGVRRIQLAPLAVETLVVSVDSNGRPAEYRLELTQQVHFTINEQEHSQSFQQVGEYVFDVRDILAYKQQLQQLQERLSRRLSQQVLFAFSSRLRTLGSMDAN